jgi:glucan phosphorylase
MSQSVRTGLTSEEIKQDFRENVRCGLGRLERTATKRDLYYALALTIRDRVFQRTVESMESYGGANARRVAYFRPNICLVRISRITFSISVSLKQLVKPCDHSISISRTRFCWRMIST